MMGSERRFVAAACLASLLAASGSAFAEPSAAERETARSLMFDGRQKREQSDLVAALKSFAAADALMHVPTTGLEVARTHVALGQLVEGRDTLRRVLLLPSRDNEPAPFLEARANAEKLDAELVERIPTVKFVLRGAPPGAVLTVDAMRIPAEAVGAPFRLNPGRHEVVARAGTATVSKKIDVRERETTEVVLELVGAGAQAATSSAASPSGAADGARAAEGGTSSGPHPLAYVGFAVAGIGIGAGVVAGLLAIGAKSTAQGGCEGARCPPSTWDDIDKARTYATVSTISFVVGGVGAGVGIVSVLVSGRPTTTAQAPNAHVEPWASAGSFGVRGSF